MTTAHQATLRLAAEPTHTAADTLLGMNFEACADAVPGMLSDRLDNPKFAGPAHPPMIGLAEGWQPANSHNMPGLRCSLMAAAGINATEAQRVENIADHGAHGICQTERVVRAGETLELEMWARAHHEPVEVEVILASGSPRRPTYDSVRITVDRAHYTVYRAELTSPADDDRAVLKIMLTGRGSLWLDQVHLRPRDEGLFCGPMIQAMDAMRIPVLRFPGGSVTSSYHWPLGIGPLHRRPVTADPQFKLWHLQYDFGTDEYLRLCHELGIRPHITVNVGAATADDAHAWAAYCHKWFVNRDIDPPPAYFQIGNEAYLNGELAHMTGEMYVRTLRDFVPGVREGYPNARIVALGPEQSQSLRGPEHATALLDPVLDEAHGLYDLVAIQNYKTGWFEDPADWPARIVTVVDEMREQMTTYADKVHQRRPDVRVALTEWNLWLSAQHSDGRGFEEPYDARHAFYAAGIIHALAALGERVELANFYNLVNPMGILVHRRARVEVTCVAELFGFYRAAFPGRFVPVTVDAPALGERGQTVDALCLINDAGRWLFAVNRHGTSTAQLRFEGVEPGTPDAMLAADAPTAQLVRRDNPGDGSALPPLSVTRWRLPD